ncbi:N5-carboxyaminoimidazole ribonucleotide synthase [mine drainage metagenome]|uniref:N5-carboxyaminoimidazole ribonucleotide synthase n=1 Tax=mine drainage metagenome TaxID=410659 RepID=A0A1J5T1G2_9ZZZZ
MPAERALPAGGTIGIIGGGQLGRMTALAAARLGYRCHVYCPEGEGPASQVAAALTTAAYEDEAALAAFAAAVDVVTFEFENIPAASVRVLERLVPVRPGWRVLDTAQDRVMEKRFFNGLGIATAPWRAVNSLAGLNQALAELGRPAVLKTTRFGYDGKGQSKIGADDDAAQAWRALNGAPAILEGFVDFEREVSVIVARGQDGATACFDVVENRHKNHILDVTLAPAALPAALAGEAQAIAAAAARALDLVGLLAVELFVSRDGRLLVNEMAPRPHNSGHWTMNACQTDQFEQLVRAVCGLPLGSPARFADAEMTNLIGDDILTVPALLAEPGAHLHLYGKAEARPGRKMGHVNRIRPLSSF